MKLKNISNQEVMGIRPGEIIELDAINASHYLARHPVQLKEYTADATEFPKPNPKPRKKPKKKVSGYTSKGLKRGKKTARRTG